MVLNGMKRKLINYQVEFVLCVIRIGMFAGTKRFYFRTVYYNIFWIRVHLIAVAVAECVYARREITFFSTLYALAFYD